MVWIISVLLKTNGEAYKGRSASTSPSATYSKTTANRNLIALQLYIFLLLTIMTHRDISNAQMLVVSIPNQALPPRLAMFKVWLLLVQKRLGAHLKISEREGRVIQHLLDSHASI